MPKDNKQLYYNISEAASVSIFAVGVMVLIGWIFDIRLMKSILPTLVTMKANTAISFILVGASLWLSQTNRLNNKPGIFAARICAIIFGLIGLLTILEYAFKCGFGIDQLLFREDPGAVLTMYPGRMALNTAINFLIISVSILTLDIKTRRGHYPAEFLILAEGVISFLALAGYVYGVSAFYGGFARYTAMALHTTILFILALVSVLFSRPTRGLVSIFTDTAAVSVIMRRLIFVAIAVPLTLGWLKLNGERMGLFNNEFGEAFVAISNMTIIIFLTWRVASSAHMVEAKRIEAEGKLVRSANYWERTFNAVSDPVFIIDLDNNITHVNSATLQLLKLEPKDVIGKKCYQVLHGIDKPWPSCPTEKTRIDNKAHVEEVNDPNIGLPLLVSTSPIFDEAGNLTGVVHISKDISQRKKIEEELRQRVEALERFQKVTVGRELMMKELKLKIAELESKLPGK